MTNDSQEKLTMARICEELMRAIVIQTGINAP